MAGWVKMVRIVIWGKGGGKTDGGCRADLLRCVAVSLSADLCGFNR